MKKAIIIIVLSLVLVGTPAFAQQNSQATTMTTTTTTSSCIRLSFNLFPGSQDSATNGQVTLLQNFLVSGGYGSFTGRGSYGPLTFRAVQQFQSANGIIPVGIVGPITRAKIASITCGVSTQGISISSVSPSSGPIGTQVTISGSAFTSTGNIIYLDNFPGVNVNSSDGQTLVFNIPYVMPLTLGIVVLPGPLMVRVSNTNGTSNTVTFNVTGSSNTQFPSISSLTPSSGPVGTQVTVYGSGFTSSNNVIKLGQFSIGNISSSDSQTLTFTVPFWGGPYCPPMSMCPASEMQIAPGTYPLSIVNSNGTSNSLNFTVTSGSSNAPVISNVSAPTSLNINQTGTWTVSATDPQNGQLSYSVDWGDNYNQCSYGYNCPTSGSASANSSFQQSTTFTHSYSQSGTYTQTFSVRNPSGLQAQTSTTVQVGNTSTNSPYLSYLYPSSGQTGTTVTIHGSGFTSGGNNINFSGVSNFNLNNLSSSDGGTLVFTVPYSDDYPCLHSNPRCEIAQRMTAPGNHSVSVTNSNGATSNSLTFTVSGNAVY